MKTLIEKLKIVTIMITFISAPLIACEKIQDNSDRSTLSEKGTGQVSAADNDLHRQLDEIPGEDLSQQELDGLVFLREEEKLAGMFI